MQPNVTSRVQSSRLLQMMLMCAAVSATAFGQAQAAASPSTHSAATASVSAGAGQRRPGVMPRAVRLTAMSNRARDHYESEWGVDDLEVRSAESGQMIRFSYTVLDPRRAAALNDKKANPTLIDEQANVKLIVPTMEKVGQLRQSTAPEAGRSYWMVFSNKGSLVKPGDRVTVVIGTFRADGLYVR